MKYREFENAVALRIFNFMGEWNYTIARICKRCYNKKMDVDATVSHIIVNA